MQSRKIEFEQKPPIGVNPSRELRLLMNPLCGTARENEEVCAPAPQPPPAVGAACIYSRMPKYACKPTLICATLAALYIDAIRIERRGR